MDLLPNTQPAPRLLSSAVLEHQRAASTPPAASGQLRRAKFLRGNGLAIFAGFAIAAALLAGGARFMSWQEEKIRAEGAVRKLLAVKTKHISASREKVVPPEPLMIQIRPEHIVVTAISLGHPRLAVINNRQISEGEYLVVRTPTAHVTVRLRVTRIADGRIELTDGMQTITARIGLPPKKES